MQAHTFTKKIDSSSMGNNKLGIRTFGKAHDGSTYHLVMEDQHNHQVLFVLRTYGDAVIECFDRDWTKLCICYGELSSPIDTMITCTTNGVPIGESNHRGICSMSSGTAEIITFYYQYNTDIKQKIIELRKPVNTTKQMCEVGMITSYEKSKATLVHFYEDYNFSETDKYLIVVGSSQTTPYCK